MSRTIGTVAVRRYLNDSSMLRSGSESLSVATSEGGVELFAGDAYQLSPDAARALAALLVAGASAHETECLAAKILADK